MNRRVAQFWLVLSLALLSVAFAEPLRMTHIGVSGTNVSLSWSHITNRYIVARSSGIGGFELTGSVLSTPQATLSNTNLSGFYQVRKVQVATFPDATLRAAVRAEVIHKYSPETELYDIDFPGLTLLDAQGITNATGMEWLTDLTFLSCQDNPGLSRLDLHANTNLNWLFCGSNSLTNLDLSANAQLISTFCGENDLTELLLPSNASLMELYCQGNRLTSLDLSGCPRLSALDCDDNRLASLDLSANTNLSTLFCYSNRLERLDVSACPQLTDLYCFANRLTNINLSASGALTSLDCQHNNLTRLDLSACPDLDMVYCGSNPLVEIIVADTNSLPAIFSYTGHPVIREP